MKVALHTEVRADRIEEYDAAHREVSPRASEAEREGGTDLFPVLDVGCSAQGVDASLPVVWEL
ncbi:hypothetical protein [Streptomyces canus]|uniref:hypothetical protein n=1 Tax=Streptomyces canus TaxID=58343 RepID=UPI0033A31E3C